MNWVTRSRPKTDRIACPWLIRRFIDPDAVIVYVAPTEVVSIAGATGARSFDAPGAEYTHQPRPEGSEWCSLKRSSTPSTWLETRR